jgi:hypothetical protein
MPRESVLLPLTLHCDTLARPAQGSDAAEASADIPMDLIDVN